MKVIVIGDGKIGRTIVEHACKEGHEVVVVDKRPNNIEQVVNQYDVMGLCGNGASYDILKDAGVKSADLVVASTSFDETNILSCLIAQKLGAKSTIARVRSHEYTNQISILKSDLGITMTINPEKEASDEIVKILNFPQALKIDSFAKGSVDLIELYIPENSPLVGQSLIEIYKKYQLKVLICAVQRNDDVYIPTGSFVIQAKDKIHITANSKTTLNQFLDKSGLIQNKLKSVMIIGGGKLVTYLGQDLLKHKFQVKIIENNYDRCLELSQLLPNATIIHGDGTDQVLLEEEGLSSTDAVVCTTGKDEQNIIISMYANKNNVKKIITKINKSNLGQLLETIDMASIISPKEITASKIVSYIRALNNKRGSNVNTLYKLVNNKVEAVEFTVKENKKLNNICFKDLKLKPNTLVAAIIRNGDVIIPSGMDQMQLNDNVIVVTTNQYLNDLENILE